MAFDLDDDELRATRKLKNLDGTLMVNEYVRTKNGEIGIFKGYNNYKNSKWPCKVKLQGMKFWKYYTKEDIVQHSKNLIKLIEVGDFVNGRRVIFVGEHYVEVGNADDWTASEILKEADITEILTKELYKANCYKVGGE